MAFTVSARVQRPGGPGSIKAVTVDVTKLGGSRAEPLYDDGEHDDEKAGDGTYAATIRFDAAVFQQQGFRETNLLTVRAIDDSGAPDTWPAVVRIPRGAGVIDLMRGGYDSARTEGPVTIRQVRDQGVRPRTNALCFAATAPGPWRAAWLMPGDGVNGAGRRWLTLYVKGDTNQELTVHLVDHHKIGSEGFFDEPHFSRPVPLIAGGYLKAVTPTHQQVRIPIDKLLPKGVFFLRWHTAGIALSAAKGAKPGTYYVDLARLEP
jgi:hypothetical protein